MKRMKKIRMITFTLLITTLGSEAWAEVRYQAGKDVNFEEMLIQGQLKRPEISVVTGNTKQGADGLLRLRENFLDRITSDSGEESAE